MVMTIESLFKMTKSRRDGGPILTSYLTGIKFKIWVTLRFQMKRLTVILFFEFRKDISLLNLNESITMDREK
jgi:hypothetical protein